MNTVVLLIGILAVGPNGHLVTEQFKSTTACSAAKATLEAAYPNSTLDCLGGAVKGTASNPNGGIIFGYSYN